MASALVIVVIFLTMFFAVIAALFILKYYASKVMKEKVYKGFSYAVLVNEQSPFRGLVKKISVINKKPSEQ